jgi:hypothetical protein
MCGSERRGTTMQFDMKFARSAIAGAALLIASVGAAQALPTQGVYSASTGAKDPAYYGGSGSHAFWLPGIPGGNDYVFTPTNGLLTVDNTAKTMSLTGFVRSVSQPANVFQVSVDFKHYSEFPASAFVGGTPMPNLELNSNAYSPGPGGIDPSTWDYYVLLPTSTLTGIGGAVNGVTVSLSQRPNSGALDGPKLTQIGDGANGKNLTFGLSTWFNYTSSAWNGTGDININLEYVGDPNSVPEPAALALLGIGLAGVGVASRRRKRA